ncbi:MAG: hemerythrin domain-containing protein [Asticcacaulis sp.]
MDIYTYIKRDHMRVTELMQQLLDIRLAAFHRRLFDQIKSELLLHTEAEERTFYKAIEAASRHQALPDETLSDPMVHAHNEHEDIRRLLDELTEMSENNEMWMVKFGELKHAVTHHVEEEETEVWKKARLLLMPAQEQMLARDMDREKQKLRAEIMTPAQ